MKYLSLFSGVEGGGLAFQHLIEPKITCIGYVENDDYCQRVIRQRQIDGLLDKAPIYGDIRTFIDSGCAKLYRGIADVITAGFPCQPFSVAGKRKGADDEKNMWPATIATICLVRPRYALLENVPGLLVSGYIPRIFADLAEAGYNARWTVLGADDVGARHRRKRLWIVAYSNPTEWRAGYPEGCQLEGENDGVQKGRQEVSGRLRVSGQKIPNPNERRSQPGNDIAGRKAGSISAGHCEGAEVADSKSQRIRLGKHEDEEIFLVRSAEWKNRCAISSRSRGTIWTTEPALGRVAHGMAYKLVFS